MDITTTCVYGGIATSSNSNSFWELQNATCTTAYDSSTAALYASGFSYGSIVIAIELLLILGCALTLTYFLHFRKVRIKN